MSLSDRDNPYARPSAWPPAPATKAVPTPPAPPARNSIFSGSAVPIGPGFARIAPQPADPKPHPEVRPPSEPRPPLRSATFVGPPSRRRRTPGLQQHVPLLGSLLTAVAGLSVMAVVFTREPPAPPIPPPHQPTHLANLRTVVPASERPTLRGAVSAALARARGRAPEPHPAPPVTAAAAPVAVSLPAPAPKAAQPRFTPQPLPDPDAPITTRAPYG